MTGEDYLSMFRVLFLWQLPTFVISSWGLWLAVSRKDRLGRVSTWAIPGFGLLIIYTLIGVALRVSIMGIRTNQMIQGGSEAAMSISRVNIWNLAAYPLFIVGFALVARAVFLDRDRSSRKTS